MLKIHFSFWIAAGIFLALGMGRIFFMLTISVTAHELAHILTARVLGLKARQLKISALGEMAYIEQMDRLTSWKRGVIIAAGPFCNLLLWIGSLWAALLWADPSEVIGMFGFYNLILFIFNLMPIFPLDGARLFQLLGGNFFGAMSANRWTLRAGKVCCVILMLLGIVQAALYAPNFTMLIMGFVLYRKNRSLQVELIGEFYMAMLNKSHKLAEGPMPARLLCTTSDLPLKDVINYLTWDNILVVFLTDQNNTTLTEIEIIKYIIQNGLNNTLSDVDKMD